MSLTSMAHKPGNRTQSNRQPEGDSPPSLSTVGTLLRERDETGETPNKLQYRASIAGATNFYASCTAIPLQRGIICPNLSRKRRGAWRDLACCLAHERLGYVRSSEKMNNGLASNKATGSEIHLRGCQPLRWPPVCKRCFQMRIPFATGLQRRHAD
jgi:hypothetical protein